MRFTGLKKAAAGAAVALIAAGTMAMTAAPANAEGVQARGFNGQQIEFCINSNGASAQASGWNQNGQWVDAPRIALNSGCTPLKGWWFKGDVQVNWHAPSGDKVKTCTVPVRQTGDYFRCNY